MKCTPRTRLAWASRKARPLKSRRAAAKFGCRCGCRVGGGRRADGVEVGLDHPGLHDVSLVGATYGLPTRTLGTVGLLGPVRMDYDKAVRTVRAAAYELSRLVETAYGEG